MASALRAPTRQMEEVTRARILVVDDDESARVALEKLLRGDDFEIATAPNGEAALGEVASATPDLVLTDLRMHPVNGVELCQRLHDFDDRLPVLVMTAHADVQSAIECLRAGADDYLTKPLQYEEVLWRLERALERRSAKRAHEELYQKFNEQLVLQCLREEERAHAEALHGAQLNALLENLTEGVTVVDAEGRVVILNQAARTILGIADCDIGTLDAFHSSLRAHDLHGHPLAGDDRPLVRALRGEQFADYEIVRVRPNGERRRVVSSGTCVRDDSGKVVLAIVVFRDVTDARRLEAQREEYLALVSHDLRNPLTSIHGFASLIKSSIEDEIGGRTRRVSFDVLVNVAERVRRNVERMTTMLEELTEATRLDAQGVVLQRQPCDLSAIVAGVIERMDDERGKRISIESDGAAYLAAVDVARIERAITNLITNALKYSDVASPVTVHFERDDVDVVMDVIDHGIGIAPESATRLFERYYRTNAGKARASGLGLGLYITRQIVEAHGGRIEVSSEVGRGSTFRVRLPALRPCSPTERIER